MVKSWEDKYTGPNKKVNEIKMYVSEMRWDLHDNHSHKTDMAFVDENENEEWKKKPGGQDTMKNFQGSFTGQGHRQPCKKLNSYIVKKATHL